MTETARKPRGNQCLCTVCGLMFKNEGAFARHRAGDFAGPTKPNTRRCRTATEMSQAGLVYVPDREEWRFPPHLSLPEAFRRA